jgi:hypothetical protein
MRLIALFLALSLQNTAQSTSGGIEGIVTSGSARIPISGARVRILDTTRPLDNPAATYRETTTDANGRFALPEIPAGQYEISIAREGFGDRRSGRDSVSRIVTVEVGKTAQVAEISLSPSGTIHGRILDADGKGVSFAAVEFLRSGTMEPEQRTWIGAARTLTDKEGAYRKAFFDSGDYYVRVVLESGAIPKTIYYPSTSESTRAARVILPEGAEVAADIRIGRASPEQTFQIAGTVTLPPVDVVAPFIELVLSKRNAGDPVEASIRSSTRASDGAGNFEFREVPPGNYELVASARVNSLTYQGKLLIDVRDRDQADIQLAVRPPLDVKGRFVIDGNPQDVRFAGRGTDAYMPGARILLSLSLVNGNPLTYRAPDPVVGQDGKSFSFIGIPEGDYRLAATIVSGLELSQDFYIEDIRAGSKSVGDSGLRVGVDVVDSIEVIVGTKMGTVEGRIVGCDSEQHLSVSLIPEAPKRSDRYRSAPAAADGHFEFARVPPGNYAVLATPRSDDPPLPTSIVRDAGSPRVTVLAEKTSGGVRVPCLEKSGVR